MGWILDIDKFHGGYFNIMGRNGHSTDPESRILLETTFEVIVDAG